MPKSKHKFKESDLAWQRNLVHSMEIGVRWGVPRNGLVYEKLSETEFALVARLQTKPLVDGMTEELKSFTQYQKAEHELISAAFNAVGVTVTDRTVPS